MDSDDANNMLDDSQQQQGDDVKPESTTSPDADGKDGDPKKKRAGPKRRKVTHGMKESKE